MKVELEVPGTMLLPDELSMYTIDEDGKVFSIRTMKYLTPKIVKQGNRKERVMVEMVKNNGKRFGGLVHRLIAQSFIPNPLDKPEVNHLDGNPMNNRINNLEWATKAENVKHAQDNYLYGSSQKPVDVFTRDGDHVGSYISMQRAADVLGMKSKNANKNISETCAKNASKDLINSRHPLGLFMSEGYVFKFPV